MDIAGWFKETLPWLRIDSLRCDQNNARDCIQTLSDSLRIKPVGYIEKVSRLVLSNSVYLPSWLRYQLNEVLIRLRNRYCRTKNLPDELKSAQALNRFIQSSCASLPDWNGKKSVICLSHDIDYSDCWNFLPELSDIERSYGLRSTINVLTHGDYRIKHSLLNDLVNEGFEIGLHGKRHDIALAYRKKTDIRRAIHQSLEKLSLPVKGFRSPALSMSVQLLEVLEESGFSYDSSVPLLNPYGASTEFCYPFRFPKQAITEIPLGIQDDILFRALRLSDDAALSVSRQYIEKTMRLGGIMVINTHPGIIKHHQPYYKNLLSYMLELPDCWICTLEKLMEFTHKKGAS